MNTIIKKTKSISGSVYKYIYTNYIFIFIIILILTSLIFGVVYVYNKLNNEGFAVSMISSELDATERRKTMNDFRTGKTRVLLSTDLLSRGIDIQQVSVIINFDIPFEKETYLHRIGRSGRFGKKGLAISFVCENEYSMLSDIEKFYNCQINELPENLANLF